MSESRPDWALLLDFAGLPSVVLSALPVFSFFEVAPDGFSKREPVYGIFSAVRVDSKGRVR
jgi:hypothetical protein